MLKTFNVIKKIYVYDISNSNALSKLNKMKYICYLKISELCYQVSVISVSKSWVSHLKECSRTWKKGNITFTACSKEANTFSGYFGLFVKLAPSEKPNEQNINLESIWAKQCDDALHGKNSCNYCTLEWIWNWIQLKYTLN